MKLLLSLAQFTYSAVTIMILHIFRYVEYEVADILDAIYTLGSNDCDFAYNSIFNYQVRFNVHYNRGTP